MILGKIIRQCVKENSRLDGLNNNNYQRGHNKLIESESKNIFSSKNHYIMVKCEAAQPFSTLRIIRNVA